MGHRVALLRQGGFILALCLLLAVGSTPARAAGATPTEQLKETIDQVLVILARGEGDRAARIARIIRPRFDFTTMAQLTLHKFWKEQSAADQARFLELFPRLLEKTYIAKMSLYESPRVEYLRERRAEDKAEVETRVVVNNTALLVSYRMHCQEGAWRIYDVNVEGVSLVRNYRSQLTAMLEQGGFATLLARIEEKIRAAGAG
ncbi:MAG: ABC transporter substrate-binding protein [Thermodesulfobacteriota bacterium]